MSSSWYRDVFPHARLSPDKNTELHFETTRGGYRYATSVGGTLTGIGGDYIIIDDPMKAEDGESEAALEAEIDRMRIVNFPRIDLCRPEGDKIVRMARQCARIADGSILLPRDAAWLKIFLNECRAFPHGKHDDQVDSMTQFLNWRDDFGPYAFRCYTQ